jgi:hypothetical protein
MSGGGWPVWPDLPARVLPSPPHGQHRLEIRRDVLTRWIAEAERASTIAGACQPAGAARARAMGLTEPPVERGPRFLGGVRRP